MIRLGRQRGISFMSLLVVLMVAGIFFTVGFKLFTPYADHGTITSVIESVVADQEELKKPLDQIKRDIARRFTINQVSLPEKDSLKITQKESELTFDIKYEIRVPMFYNVDAVVKFEEQYKADKP